MGARKNINVTGTNENTAASTYAGTFTHAQFFAADGTTAISNPFALDTPQALIVGGMLNIVDAGLYLKLGVAGSTVVGQLSDVELKAMLDARYPAGATTAVVKFGTDATMSNSTAITAHTIDAWDAAVSF